MRSEVLRHFSQFAENVRITAKGPRKMTSRQPSRNSAQQEQPLAPFEVWGHYNNYRSAGLKGSAMVHTVIFGLIVAASFGTHAVQKEKPREVVTLIAPSPDTYTMQTAKKEVSGGGGGGDHDPMPVGQRCHIVMERQQGQVAAFRAGRAGQLRV